MGLDPGQGGGVGLGVLSVEKGTDCGLTVTELWLLQAVIAKMGGLSTNKMTCKKGAVKIFKIKV